MSLERVVGRDEEVASIGQTIGPATVDEHRRNGLHCTELARVLRLAVVGSRSQGSLDRQRWQLVVLEILGSEQEDVVGLCQPPARSERYNM